MILRSMARPVCVAAALMLGLVPAARAEVNTIDITQDTLSALPSCLDFRLEGVCFWLRCSLIGGCSIETSIRVGHYTPDLVISAYHEAAENPWREIRKTLGHAQELALEQGFAALIDYDPGEGAQHDSRPARNHATVTYKEADAIGHPAADIVEDIPLPEGPCPSAADMMTPYYQSAIDAVEWRLGVVEFVAHAHKPFPGVEELSEDGTWGLQTWGGVYPRVGQTPQPEDAKAAGIAAFRAGHIVTRSGEPGRVYDHLSSGGTTSTAGYRVWLPDPLEPGDAETGTFQMHHPRSESSCEILGVDDRFDGLDGWAGGTSSSRTDLDGDYVWTMWRRYSCCEREGSFITSVSW